MKPINNNKITIGKDTIYTNNLYLYSFVKTDREIKKNIEDIKLIDT